MNTALRERAFLMCGAQYFGVRHTAPAIAFREQCRIRRVPPDPRRSSAHAPIDVSDKAGGGLDDALNWS
jgi:hypothetical protein